MQRLLALILLVLATGAQAGPWPRAEGEGFLSFSGEIPMTGLYTGAEMFGTAYIEFGLTERVTLGFDLGGSQSDLYKAVGFARIPVEWFDGPFAMSVELGVGVTADQPVLRPGFAIGRGFGLGGASGWMSLETLAHIGAEDGDTDVTTDITFGVNMSDRSKLILQLQSGHHLMDPEYLKFAPSFVYERKPGQHLELGVLAGIENAEDFALKLGLWHEF